MSIPNFRELYETLLRHEGENLYQEVLIISWQDKADQAMKPLKAYGNVEAKNWSTKGILEDLWDLYALSRVSDILLLRAERIFSRRSIKLCTIASE